MGLGDTLDHILGAALLLTVPFRRRIQSPEIGPEEMREKMRSRSVPLNGHHPPAQLRALTWNVYAGHRGAALSDALEELAESYDIMFLQEAPVRAGKGMWEDGPLASYHAIYCTDFAVGTQDRFFDFEHSGNLVLSRYPFERTEVVPLPTTLRIGRVADRRAGAGAAYGRIRAGDGRAVGLCAARFNFHCLPHDREIQARALVGALEGYGDDVTIVGMDANAMLRPFGAEPALSAMREAGYRDVCGDRLRGYPHFFDYLFVRGDVAAARGRCLSFDGASDHQPVSARVRLS